MDETWDPKEALKGLALEQDMSGMDDLVLAEKLFKENLSAAAMSICHTAVYGTNEQTRLRAAQYVVERNLGTLSEVTPKGATDPFEELLAECVSEEEVAVPVNGEPSGD